MNHPLRQRRSTLLLVGLLPVLFATGCPSDVTTETGCAPPGLTQDCTCDDGASGIKICQTDSTFTVCVCDDADMGVNLDLVPSDTGSASDTSSADSGSPDMTVADTGALDTTVVDTSSEDAGSDSGDDVADIGGEDVATDTGESQDTTLDSTVDIVDDTQAADTSIIDATDVLDEPDEGLTCDLGYQVVGSFCELSGLPSTPFNDERFTVSGLTVQGDGTAHGSSSQSCFTSGITTAIQLPEVRPDAGVVIEITTTWRQCETQGTCGDGGGVAPALRLDGRIIANQPFLGLVDSPFTEVICLGEVDFGGTDPVTLSVGTRNIPYTVGGTCSGGDNWFDFESVVVRDANMGECPAAQSTISNGDFGTGDLTGWRAGEFSGPIPPDVVMSGGGNAFRLEQTDSWCDGARISHLVDVEARDSGPGLLLRVEIGSNAALPYRVAFGGDIFPYEMRANHAGTSTNGVSVFQACLPPFAYGAVQQVEVELGAVTSGPDCDTGNATGSYIELRDVRLTETSACSVDGTLTDGDFEDGLFGWWTSTRNGNTSTATVERLGETDNTFLKLAPAEPCASSTIQQYARPAEGDRYLRFDYRYTADDAHPEHWTFGVLWWADWLPTFEPTTWTEETICIPQGHDPFVGLPITFFVDIGGSCTGLADSFLDLDNIEFIPGDTDCVPETEPPPWIE